MDLMSIERRLEETGYIWQKFIRDVATIVNNATLAFEVSPITRIVPLSVGKFHLILCS